MSSKRRSECAAMINAFRTTQSLPISARQFLVTREWVQSHINFGTPTATQLAILGETWPPMTGWLPRIVGLRICESSRVAFEASQKNRNRSAAVVPEPPVTEKDSSWKWTFGKHSGRLLSETPIEYLDWVSENFKNGEIKDMAIREIHRRKVPSPPAVIKRTELFEDVEPKPISDPLTQGQYDCSHLYDPNYGWPGDQKWDGVSPPWEDQQGCDELSKEFRAIVG